MAVWQALAVLSVNCRRARVLNPQVLGRMLDRFEAVLLQSLDQGVALLLRHSDVVGSTLIIVLHLFLQLVNYIINRLEAGTGAGHVLMISQPDHLLINRLDTR